MRGTNWEKLKEKVYFRDGSFRDIYILETSRVDWGKWIDYVNENYRIEWYNGKTKQDENKIDFRIIQEYWNGNEELISTAKVFIGKIQINAHFFIDTEIENDIDPREFNSVEDHYKLIKYLTDLSILLDKGVLLTPENKEETPIIKIDKLKIEYID